MATTEKKPAKGAGQPQQQSKSGKSKGDKKGAEFKQAPHAGAGLPVPPPRLKGYYEKTVRARLQEQFGLENKHEIPTVEKIVVNCGVG